jgi:integrase
MPRFNARNVISAPPGRHHAGTPGLYLYVSPDAQVRRWIYRYTSPVTRRVTETGFGPVTVVTLAEARDKALNIRRMIANGVDPIHAKRIERVSQTAFAQVCEGWITTHKPGWRSNSQLRSAKLLLFTHGKALSTIPITLISADLVQSALTPLWERAPNQARRTLAMWARVFDYAKAKGFRMGDNPAAWRGCHEYRIARQRSTGRHYTAMPYEEVPNFIRLLRIRKAKSAIALEFCILTACRTAEVLNAQWSEFDFENRIWLIPAARTKTSREHRVPLTDATMELLLRQKLNSTSAFVFTGYSSKPLSPKSMILLLRKMNKAATVHGFRSSFRDYCGNETDFSREHVEECLAQQVGNNVERAYRRSDALEKRRVIMNAWVSYLDGTI